MKITKKIIAAFVVFDFFLLLALVAVFLFFNLVPFDTPRLDREWSEDQSILATSVVQEAQVTIKNVRNFEYRSVDDYTPGYYDQTYDLNALEQAWYIIEPFGDRDGPAHTMMVFDFSDGKSVTISAEIRKEKGESFSALKGLFQQYEIVYMIGDDRDLIRLRTNYRKNNLYMYPLDISQESMRALFISMLDRANALGEYPEFYHTIQNNCTTVLRDHANVLLDDDIPWGMDVLLPKNSDKILFEMELIDTELTSVEELRNHYLITPKAQALDDDASFSQKIRPSIR